MRFITSGGYTFALKTTRDLDMTMYDFVSLETKPYPCVRITAYKDVMTLDTLNPKELEPSSGTIYMLKTALTYAMKKHPSVQHIELQDETFADTTGKPMITARRLLHGQQGWYEEHLQASPIHRTVHLLDFLRDPKRRMRIDAKLPNKPNTWWTAANVMKVCEEIHCPSGILGTMWKIERNTVNSYGITYSYKRSTKTSGGTIPTPNHFPYELILQAKYRNKT